MKMNVLYDFAEIILCAHALIKYVFRRTSLNHGQKNFGVVHILYELLCIVTAPVLCVSFILLVLPFVIARAIINIYLKLKHGEKYGGLFQHMDSLWRAETNEAKHIITILAFTECEKSPEETVIQLKQSLKICGIIFNSTIHNILGYTYRLRSREIADKMVRLISLTSEETSDKSKFEEKISNLANEALPAGSGFELLVCVEPITFNNTHGEINERRRVVIGRFHHSLGDGVTFALLLTKINNDENNVEHVISKLSANKYIGSSASRKEVFQESKKSSTFLNEFIQRIKDTALHHVNLLEPVDQNILHGPTLTGQKIVVFETDRDSIYVRRIKSIRRKLKDCKFSDVLCTSISASLCEHFYQHSQHVPSDVNIFCVVPIPRRSDNSNRATKYVFSGVTFKTPIHIDGCKSAEENLILRLETVKTRRETLQKCIDPLINYWFVRYFSNLPIGLLKLISEMETKYTTTLSNLPGLQSTKIGGEKAENIVICTPNVANMGVGITIHTYRDCLQISLVVDKGLVPNSEDARLILKNIYKYIDMLDKEVEFKN